MLRPAFAIALPALALAYMLAKTDMSQRTALATALRGALGASPVPPTPVPPAASVTPVALQPSIGPDAVAIDADSRGQFQTTMLVAGRQMPALIDTGATFVVLTAEDAGSIGIHPGPADFKYAVQTANGTSRVAATVLASVRIGNVEARQVPALVAAPHTLTGQSLVGMSFLRKLSGFEIQAGRLVLKQ